MPTEPNYPYFVLIAGQRCGTNALAAFLNGGPVFRSYGEIFLNPVPPSTVLSRGDARNANFFRFRQRLFELDREMSIPTRANQKTIWTEFTAFVTGHADGQIPLLDIKYNSLHHLNEIWCRAQSEPLLITLLRNSSIPVIQLIRDDLFERALSYLIAMETERWHWYRDADNTPPPPIQIEPQRVVDTIASFAEEERVCSGWLATYRRRLVLHYEEAFTDDGRLADAARAALSGFLSAPIVERQIGILKSPVTKSQIVANLAEIADHVRAAGMVG